MNTTTATTFPSRAVERVVRGQAASDGDGVKLTRVLTQPLQQRLDPFLMLDAFGSDAASDYIGGFPDHPHRGFETVTIMLEGRMRHRDSVGNVGLLEPGSVQWMTAGRGIIHSRDARAGGGPHGGLPALGQPAGQADKMTRAGVPRHRAGGGAGVQRRRRRSRSRHRRRQPRHGGRGDAAEDRAGRPRPDACRRAARSTPSCRRATTRSPMSSARRRSRSATAARRAVEPERMAILANDAGQRRRALRGRRPTRPSRRASSWSPAGRSASRSRSTGRS